MIGIFGEDGEGYRWLLPRLAEVREGDLRVIPFPSRVVTARTCLLNAALLVMVVASDHDQRAGRIREWHAVFYLVVLAVLLLQLVLRIAGTMRRQTIRIALPLKVGPVPTLYWADQVQFLCALSCVLGVCIESDHPNPMLPWGVLSCVSAILCVIVALLPWLNQRLFLRRRD